MRQTSCLYMWQTIMSNSSWLPACPDRPNTTVSCLAMIGFYYTYTPSHISHRSHNIFLHTYFVHRVLILWTIFIVLWYYILDTFSYVKIDILKQIRKWTVLMIDTVLIGQIVYLPVMRLFIMWPNLVLSHDLLCLFNHYPSALGAHGVLWSSASLSVYPSIHTFSQHIISSMHRWRKVICYIIIIIIN